ncbi:MAG: diguanylate cyclase [Lachnospiraceae bacterium]|nr:diguanylate cyclase [Lachnospiraceae bacterium]
MKQTIYKVLNNLAQTEDKTLLLQQMIDCFPIGITIISNGLFSANKKFYQMTEQTKTFDTVDEYLEGCRQDYILYRSYSSLLTHNQSFVRLYPIKTPSSQEYYVENSTFIIKDQTQNAYYVSVLIDRTETSDLSARFEENNDRFRIVEELMEEYLFEYDLAKDTLHFSERWKPDGINTDYPHAQKWLELHEIIHPDDFPFLLDAMHANRVSKELRTLEFRARFSKHDYNWYRICYKLIRSKQTNTLRAIGKISNINAERLAAGTDLPEGVDSRTGLLIPSYMQNCVDQSLLEEPPEHLCALMLLQLDNFAELKKSTGDLYTSRIECQVAQQLKQSFRNTDIIGYSQEGCYMVFLRKVPEDIITMRALNVLNSIKGLSMNDVDPAGISCSIGVSLAPTDGTSYMELFLKADSAMYLSKARGGSTYSYFNTKIDNRQRSTRS